jgi:hypothetical protein
MSTTTGHGKGIPRPQTRYLKKCGVKRVSGLSNAPDPYRRDKVFESRGGMIEFRGARMNLSAGRLGN